MKVILLMAATVDGIIARNSRELIDWSGKADKKYFVSITKEAGVMIMGSRTFDTIGRVLPERKNIVMTRDKTRISTDPALIFTDKAPEEILSDLEAEGHESVVLIGGSIINTLFMQEKLIDEIYVTVVPKLFGKGLSLFSDSVDADLKLIGIKKIEDSSMVLKYQVL